MEAKEPRQSQIQEQGSGSESGSDNTHRPTVVHHSRQSNGEGIQSLEWFNMVEV